MTDKRVIDALTHILTPDIQAAVWSAAGAAMTELTIKQHERMDSITLMRAENTDQHKQSSTRRHTA
jgi:hypothetical protein